MQKVYFISLGCARNRVDTEVMIGALTQRAWQLVNDIEDADVVVINTCGFIGPAKEESISTILEVAEHKKDHPQMRLVVTGCLAQRYSDQLAKGMPEVDLFIGTDEFANIGELLAMQLPSGAVRAARTDYLRAGHLPKINTLATASAYVKVAEGCQHNCAFCIIPAIRGKLRSRPLEHIVTEITTLAAQGVIEINLIAQDLAAYGRDGGPNDLLALLKSVVAIDKIQWVRLLYVYPENIDDELLDFFAREPKIVKYLDIPIQHASDAVLARMRRSVSADQLRTILSKVRAKVSGMAIRTSVMVGFPGETTEDFAQLMDFVREQRFEHLGCFCYSKEEGTAAFDMPEQIDEETKTARRHAIMVLQQQISREHLQKHVGKVQAVLIKGISDETDLLAEGRLSTQAPEVDGVVYINDGDFRPGTIQHVKITEAHEYDLIGHIVE